MDVSNSARFRIGAVRYLNTKPLIYTLEKSSLPLEITYDYPSRLAESLALDALDAATIPAIELLRNERYSIISNACIACQGPVMSVKLFGRVPPEKIGRLALDEGSRTSAMLTRILLVERYGVVPRLEPLPLGLSEDQTDADAVLLIGDRGMTMPEAKYEFVWDLGEEWTQWTGLPFVFSCWVARPDLHQPALGEAFNRARDEGERLFEEIARRESPKLGISEEVCLTYFRDYLHFHLGERERQGLRLFYELAIKHRFVEATKNPIQ